MVRRSDNGDDDDDDGDEMCDMRAHAYALGGV
jgi:hypothetical protein